MTENEAIKLLKKANSDNDMVCILPKSDIGKCLIKALEEIQNYHALEMRIQNLFGEYYDVYTVVEEFKQFQQTIEKTIARKPIVDITQSILDGDVYICPTCKEKYNRFYKGKSYCMRCGQRLDWSEDE